MSCGNNSVVSSLVGYFYPDNLNVRLEIDASQEEPWTDAGYTVEKRVIPDERNGNAPLARYFVLLPWTDYIENKMDALKDEVEEEIVTYSDINGQKFRWSEDQLTVRDWLSIWGRVKQKMLELTDPENHPAQSLIYNSRGACLQGLH